MERITARTTGYVLIGWLAGLAVNNWFAHAPPPVSLGWHAALVLMGTPAAGLLIGGGLTVLAAMISKALTGSIDGNPLGYLMAAFAGPILAYFSAMQALLIAASFT